MGTHPIFESDFDCLTDCKTMTSRYSASGSRYAAPAKPEQKSVSLHHPQGALCVEDKNVMSSTSIEVEAHVAVTTDVVLEDLTVFGDCRLSTGGEEIHGGRFGPSRRPAYAWDPKQGKRIEKSQN